MILGDRELGDRRSVVIRHRKHIPETLAKMVEMAHGDQLVHENRTHRWGVRYPSLAPAKALRFAHLARAPLRAEPEFITRAGNASGPADLAMARAGPPSLSLLSDTPLRSESYSATWWGPLA